MLPADTARPVNRHQVKRSLSIDAETWARLQRIADDAGLDSISAAIRYAAKREAARLPKLTKKGDER